MATLTALFPLGRESAGRLLFFPRREVGGISVLGKKKGKDKPVDCVGLSFIGRKPTETQQEAQTRLRLHEYVQNSTFLDIHTHTTPIFDVSLLKTSWLISGMNSDGPPTYSMTSI